MNTVDNGCFDNYNYHLVEFSDWDPEDLSELFGREERAQTPVDVRHKVRGKHDTEPGKVLPLLGIERRLLRSATVSDKIRIILYAITNTNDLYTWENWNWPNEWHLMKRELLIFAATLRRTFTEMWTLARSQFGNGTLAQPCLKKLIRAHIPTYMIVPTSSGIKPLPL